MRIYASVFEIMKAQSAAFPAVAASVSDFEDWLVMLPGLDLFII